MDVFYCNRHHLAHTCLALVTDNADWAHEVLAQLSFDITQDWCNHIVLQRHFSVLLYEFSLSYLPTRIGVGDQVAPLVAIAVHEASPQFAASLIKSIPAGGTLVKEVQSRARFPFNILCLAYGGFNSFVKEFIHFLKLLGV